jgi:DNA-binding CsgD family transcriptional regulator
LEALSNLILELYRAARETPVDEFQDLVLALVKVQTPFQYAHWGGGELTDKGLVAHSVHLNNESPEILDDWAASNRSNTLVIDTVSGNPGRTLVYNTPTLFSSQEHAVMLDYACRYGHLNCMTITTMSKRHPYGQWLSLYRADKHDHFGQADARMLEQVMPHLIEALEINRIIGHVPSTHVDLEMPGARAVARTDGTLYHCGKKFAEILLEVWPDWKSAQLPDELMAAVYPNRESILADHSIAIATSTLGNMLFLNIRRVSVLSRLSQRELEVARFYGQGKSYKEIGQALDISPATVRNFLGRIYTKLGIDNKFDLTSLFAAM